VHAWPPTTIIVAPTISATSSRASAWSFGPAGEVTVNPPIRIAAAALLRIAATLS
jgi:hypothetical protein